jgi:hypothetical protein
MSKARTDAQGRKFDAAGDRVYDLAGKNTFVEAIHAGTYPSNHFRQPGDKFQLKEGDAIVDWMREVEGDEAPAKRRFAAAKKPAEQPVAAPAEAPAPDPVAAPAEAPAPDPVGPDLA